MRHYENLIIFKPTLTEEELVAAKNAVNELVVKNGGEVVAIDDKGVKKLAYAIEKSERGYYYIAYFKSAPVAIKELERVYGINENILKYLTVKYEKKKEVAAWNAQVEKAQKVANA